MTGLTQEDLKRLLQWLPQVYLAGTAREVAVALDELNALMARIDQVLNTEQTTQKESQE